MWTEKHGRIWLIRDRVNGQKVTVARGYRTKTAANAAMMSLETDALRGDSLVRGGDRVTLSTWTGMWWPHYQLRLKPTSLHSEGGRLRNHVLALLGDCELGELDSLVVQRWVGQLVEGAGPMAPGSRARRRALSAKTVHNCHALLFTILSAAVAQKLIRVNPCAATTLPRREQREMRFLTDPEIVRLVAAVPAHWRPLVMLLVATGLRWGEAVGLKAGRVDLLAKTPKLTVLEHLHELSGTGEIVFTEPKSRRSRRTVTFTRPVALELTALVAGKAHDELVFTAPAGGPVRTRNFRRVWLAALERAGLGGLRVHDLRHTHAAILFSAGGLSLPGISRRLGHSSIAVTDQLYGHLREEADPGILAAIGAAMAGIPGAAALDDEIDGELSVVI